MTTQTLVDWQPIAAELAQALACMPCVCVKRSHPWPFKDQDFKDRECRRCRSLKKFETANRNVRGAA